MSPRRYRTDRRKAAAEETRRKIINATVELHAEHGALATTYAMIAKRADVAIPTVYNHFPAQGDLFMACTEHAARNAPPLGPGMFEDTPDLTGRLRALVGALDTFYEYYSPWMRKGLHEAQLLPELAAALQVNFPNVRGLIELALAPGFKSTPPSSLVTLCEILLDFPAWVRIQDDQCFDPALPNSSLVNALVAIIKDAGGKITQPNKRTDR